jgi:hypothetical protein
MLSCGRMIRLLAHTPHILLPLTTCLSSKVFLVELTDGRAGGPTHTTARKPGPLYTIQYSLLVFWLFVLHGSRCMVAELMPRFSNIVCNDKIVQCTFTLTPSFVKINPYLTGPWPKVPLIRVFYLNYCTVLYVKKDAKTMSQAWEKEERR